MGATGPRTRGPLAPGNRLALPPDGWPGWARERKRFMPETLLDALVRALRRQAAAGRRSVRLSAPVREALLAAASPRPVRPSGTPASPVPRAVTTAPVPAPAAPRADLPPVEGLGWEELQARVRECRLCGLCRERTQAVFGDGCRTAPLLFVGEGPGRDEDLAGLPFVGAAGQLLTRMIQAMQFDRSEVYIANVVKCRPPRNRMPEPAEAQACLPYLQRQIELLRPQVIVTLGATPLQFLLGKTGITRERGKWCDYRGIPAMPTYHPAFLLRAPDRKREVWEDLKQVMLRLGKDPAAARTPRRGP